MKRPRGGLLVLILVTTLVPVSLRADSSVLQSVLASRGGALVREATPEDPQDGREAFRQYVRLLAEALDQEGAADTAEKIRGSFSGAGEGTSDELAWIIHAFAREYYKDAIIRATGDLIRFKTYATDVPNRENPEFVAQREYLEALAGRLGLGFRDVGGFVQEIWIGDGPATFGIMSHSDVQPVDASGWTHDPWSGDVIDGAIWGRGAVDDKGPICAVIYGMRAILDSGLPLKKKLILLIGTDEESANEDVKTYLSTNAPPDQTIVVDSNFPVVCAEKGWCGIWLSLPRFGVPEGKGLLISDLHSGFSPSIVPEKAVARLVPLGVTMAEERDRVSRLADAFMKGRQGADVRVAATPDTLTITTFGKSVHSSVPASGHNALMDLLVFLDRDVMPLRNGFSLLASFAAEYIGFETDGKALGIAHHDDFMGDITVAADMFSSSDTSVTFMFNFRRPRGLDRSSIEKAIRERYDAFDKKNGVTLTDTRYIGEPHYNDPNSPFVQELLSVYNEVTGEHRSAGSIGGGTYAQRIPNAVVFGPALPDEEYLGHQPNEHFLLSTLVRNIEILTHAMVMFGL